MIKVSLQEAAGHLDQLVEEAAAGQEVIITSAQGPTVRLVPVLEGGEGTGDSAAIRSPKSIGHALDRFIGTWSAEQEAEVLQAIEVFERIDDSLWQ